MSCPLHTTGTMGNLRSILAHCHYNKSAEKILGHILILICMWVGDMPILWRLVPRLKEDEDALLNVNDIMDAFRAVMMIIMPADYFGLFGEYPCHRLFNRIGLLVQ